MFLPKLKLVLLNRKAHKLQEKQPNGKASAVDAYTLGVVRQQMVELALLIKLNTFYPHSVLVSKVFTHWRKAWKEFRKVLKIEVELVVNPHTPLQTAQLQKKLDAHKEKFTQEYEVIKIFLQAFGSGLSEKPKSLLTPLPDVTNLESTFWGRSTV